jgi:uncharacterized SAM-binding protein YcdF (DUF218 family)
VSEFVWFFFSAAGAMCALVVCGLWLWARPASRLGRGLLIAAALFYVVAGIHGTGHQLARLLGAGFRPFQRADVPQGRTALVVLGSGSFTARDWDRRPFSIVDPWAALRIVEAARVFALADPEWVISSGGLADAGQGAPSSGIVMRDALIGLGVPAERIYAELRSRNTHEEAVAIARVLQSLEAEHTILVTSRVHMRRSIGTFRAEGVAVIPAVARDLDPSPSWGISMLPSEEGLDETGAGVHEILGIGYYTLRGWHRF